MSRTTWAGTFMAAALVVSAAFTSPAHAIRLSRLDVAVVLGDGGRAARAARAQRLQK